MESIVDEKLNIPQMIHFFFPESFQNIVEKKKMLVTRVFFVPTMFSTVLFSTVVKVVTCTG